MKKLIICTIFSCITNILCAQTFTFEAYYDGDVRTPHSSFTINTKTKKIKEIFAGFPSVNWDYHHYYSTSEWIAFGLREGNLKVPQNINDLKTCKDYIVFNLDGILENDRFYKPKEMVNGKPADYVQRLKNLNKVLGGKVIKGSSNTQNSVNTNKATDAIDKDKELPLRLGSYSNKDTVIIGGSDVDKTYVIRTKSGKMVTQIFKDFEVRADASWVEIKSQAESAIIWLKLKENRDSSPRTAKLYLKAGDVTSYVIFKQLPF
jgi:hypothetical protein